MGQRIISRWLLLSLLLAGLLSSSPAVEAASPQARAAQSDGVTAYELIAAMNTLRMSNGLQALVEDPIINAVAQSTAEIMAANQMSWHIGDIPGRLASAGYGGGAKVFATENFAVGNHSIDEIMIVWSDASHMIPAVNAAYCNVGAGVAKSPNGLTYYVLQAAYVSGKACGEYTSPGGSGTGPGDSAGIVPQIIVPVKIAKPDKDGNVYHVVAAGQSFWSIAIAYQITIHDLEIFNNLTRDAGLQIGQRLYIPGSNTKGYATPTPVGMIHVSTPDRDGKIVHTVQAYQTLITIAEAYKTKVDTILALNGIQADWPLQIDQILLIDPGNVTPSPTPRPLTPIEMLTPESDGKYYHIVKTGETLSGIAGLYAVGLSSLMAWNRLTESSILIPEQKLLLQVTPPATETYTPAPATSTPTVTATRPAPSPTRVPSQSESSPTPTSPAPSTGDNMPLVWLVSIGLAAGGLFLIIVRSRRKQ